MQLPALHQCRQPAQVAPEEVGVVDEEEACRRAGGQGRAVWERIQVQDSNSWTGVSQAVQAGCALSYQQDKGKGKEEGKSESCSKSCAGRQAGRRTGGQAGRGSLWKPGLLYLPQWPTS